MPNTTPNDDYALARYDTLIQYYWEKSRHNKRVYKLTRSLVIVLGAFVTLVASLSSASIITSSPFLDILFRIATPVLAAVLAIVAGFSQTFHWGATWRDMVLNAERLSCERDRIRVSKPEERDPVKELETLNSLLLSESEGFFQRILGGARKEKEAHNAKKQRP